LGEEEGEKRLEGGVVNPEILKGRIGVVPDFFGVRKLLGRGRRKGKAMGSDRGDYKGKNHWPIKDTKRGRGETVELGSAKGKGEAFENEKLPEGTPMKGAERKENKQRQNFDHFLGCWGGKRTVF